MFNVDREFNPDRGRILVDYPDSENEEVDRSVNIIHINQEIPPPEWPGLDDSINLTTVKRIDGIVLCSDHPNIVNNQGVMQIRRFPTAFDNKLNAYKGFQRFFVQKPKHIYEFGLASIGAFNYCALIVTYDVIPFARRPKYTSMIKSYHEAIRRCIQTLPSNSFSFAEQLLRLDGELVIFEEDWNNFCDNLPSVLTNLCEEPEHNSNFPTNPHFFWCVKQLGQSWCYNSTTHLINCIKLHGNYTLAIHCAYDQHIENHISWWKPRNVNQSWTSTSVRNAKNYRVGLIPGLGNLTFELPEDNNCSHVQYYTKFASQVHRDRHQFFITPYIAKTLAETYSSHLNGTKQKNETAKYRILKRSGPLGYMSRLTQAAELSTPARLEFVYYSSNEETIDQGIFKAFEYTGKLYEHHYDMNMIHAMPTEKFASRLRLWEPPFTKTLTDLKDKIMAILKSNNMFTMDPNLYITPKDFHNAYIVETIIHYILLGAVKNRFPRFILGFLNLGQRYFGSGPRNFNLDIWPFENIFVNWDGKVDIISPENYIDPLSRMVNCNLTHRCSVLLQIRQSYKEAKSETNAQKCEDIAELLCHEVISLILLFQLRLTNVNISHDITLSMLFYEPIQVHTTIIYFSSTQFLQKLSVRVAKLTRSYNESHIQLFEIFDKIRTECTYPRGINIDRHLCNLIDDTIQSQQFPLRFTYGRFTEYVVILDNATFPIPQANKIVLKKALLLSNRGRKNNHSSRNLNDMIAIVFQWSEETRTRIQLKTIATAIQYLFDDGVIPEDFRMNTNLKQLLNQRPNHGLQGVENEFDHSEVDAISSTTSSRFESSGIFNSSQRSSNNSNQSMSIPSQFGIASQHSDSYSMSITSSSSSATSGKKRRGKRSVPNTSAEIDDILSHTGNATQHSDSDSMSIPSTFSSTTSGKKRRSKRSVPITSAEIEDIMSIRSDEAFNGTTSPTSSLSSLLDNDAIQNTREDLNCGLMAESILEQQRNLRQIKRSRRNNTSTN